MKEYTNLQNGVKHRELSRESVTSAFHLTVPTKETLLSSKISLYVEETKPKIPDGGWGWIVVAGCFFINLVADGVGSTFGLLNVEFLNEFKASNSATSLIGSLFLSVPLLLGPLGSALVDRYGCKYMTVIGSLVCSAGFIISSYVRNIWLMYIAFGLISGVGFCFCFVTAVVSIAFWFEKKRTLALGIAASGTGLGTVIYSPLLTYLIKEYGWRGGVLIMAALCAHMCVSGFLMSDPAWIIEEERRERVLKAAKRKKEMAKKNFEIEDIETHIPPKKGIKHSTSLIQLPTFLQEHEKVSLEVLKKLSENKKLYNIILENYPNLLSYKSASETIFPSEQSLQDLDAVRIRVPVEFSMKLKNVDTQVSPIGTEEPSRIPFFRSDSKKRRPSQSQQQQNRHNYLKNMKVQKSNLGYRGAMLNIHKYKLASSSCPDFLRNSTLTLDEDEDEDWYDDYIDVFKDLTHISLLNYLHFFLLSLSTIIMSIWFVVPYFYLPVHMSLTGYSEDDASFALSLLGFTNIIGMVALAIIGDRLNAAKMYAVCLICCGLTCAGMMIFSENYTLLLLVCGLFGLFTSSCYSLHPCILADLVPLENFTMAYGLSLLCQGIGNLAGPPTAGLLYDITQSYAQSFYQAGFWVIISGVLVGIIPYTENRKIFSNL
ncbi:monocarboxylate transporter 14-like [Sitophilus oryzae]|uniref:Monocarboxylate transporter 14-like n=1 Tax=Sitophilus oryzae TaxID=7048 RepID=A0A6J2YIE3_SITOR|nr:monocarboxylate transporter 14-like [Sitophilus oryzae]